MLEISPERQAHWGQYMKSNAALLGQPWALKMDKASRRKRSKTYKKMIEGREVSKAAYLLKLAHEKGEEGYPKVEYGSLYSANPSYREIRQLLVDYGVANKTMINRWFSDYAFYRRRSLDLDVLQYYVDLGASNCRNLKYILEDASTDAIRFLAEHEMFVTSDLVSSIGYLERHNHNIQAEFAKQFLPDELKPKVKSEVESIPQPHHYKLGWDDSDTMTISYTKQISETMILRDIFNFESQDLRSVVIELVSEQPVMTQSIRKFNDVQNNDYILRAAKELVERGGDPNLEKLNAKVVVAAPKRAGVK